MAFSINFFSIDSTYSLFLKPSDAEINASDKVPTSRFIDSIFFVPSEKEAPTRASVFLNLFTKHDEEKDVRAQSPDAIDSMSQNSIEAEEEREAQVPLKEVSFFNSKVPVSNRANQKSLERVKDIIQERDEPEVYFRYLKALESDKVLNRHKLLLLTLFKHKISK